ncbi:MAG: GNAT family N-acetyltransferase [Defluviitaleaceae bacterium]|nr:GNAT family N-acetyltransferase [Defluviitaleaceae bacterium]
MYTIHSSSGGNPAYEEKFNSLIQSVFGFSFAPWIQRGLWGDTYESYSIIEGGVMLANASVCKMELLVQGRPINAIQLGAIATRESARGKGLSRLLVKHVLAKYSGTPAFLAANPSVANFYQQFGFRQLQVHWPSAKVEINNNPAAAIECNFHDSEVAAALQSRGAFSNILDCRGTQAIQLFHLLMEYSQDIYYLPKLDAFAIAQQEGDRLFLADVIAKKPVAFQSLVNELPFAGVKAIDFGFCPDWLGLQPTWAPQDMGRELFFVKDDWNLPQQFRFPVLSET